MSEPEVINLIGEPYGRLDWGRVFGEKTPREYLYSMMYYKPVDWEHHTVKMIGIKEGKVVKVTNLCNCE